MKRCNKIALILIGFILVFVLTFIFCGGLEAVLDLLKELVNETRNAIEELPQLFKELIDLFRGFFN